LTGWAVALVGGMLIGLSASIAWTWGRRIAGVSGIWGGMLRAPRLGGFRAGFLGGLLGASALLGLLWGQALPGSESPARPVAWLVISGLLVGFGTQLGRGCTSGHGVCGISRFAPRSLVATATFMGVAAIVVLLTRHVWAGGGP